MRKLSFAAPPITALQKTGEAISKPMTEFAPAHPPARF